MNIFKKGCLGILVLIVAVVIYILAYISFPAIISPNKITFTQNPIDYNDYSVGLHFDDRELPEIITTQQDRSFLYQCYLMKESVFDVTYIYKAVLKLENDIKLEIPFPIDSNRVKELNNNISFNKLERNFNPVIRTPENNKTPNNTRLIIFSKKDEILINLDSGSFTQFYDERDRDGTIREIILYDDISNILYYERQRWHAFQ